MITRRFCLRLKQAWTETSLGTIRLAGATATAGDGTLQGSAEKGDQVVVTYDDPTSSGGGPAQAMANASITREKVSFEDTVELGNQGWIPTWRLGDHVDAVGLVFPLLDR